MRCQMVFNNNILFDVELEFVPEVDEEILISLDVLKIPPVAENNYGMFKVKRRQLMLDKDEKICVLYTDDKAEQVQVTRRNHNEVATEGETDVGQKEEPQPESAEAQSENNKELFKKNVK